MNELLAGFDQARLLEIKARLKLPEDDPIWVYLSALEQYQRLYEAVPRQIREAANAERERLIAETEKLSAQTADRITAVAETAAVTASQAADKAAAALVMKLDGALAKHASALAWKWRLTASAGVLGISIGAVVMASLLTWPTPEWVVAAVQGKSGPVGRLLGAAWNAPAGAVVLLALGGAVVAWWFERVAAKIAADMANTRI